MLYADHYHARVYPFRSSLPAAADVEFRLRWNPALVIVDEDEDVVVASRSTTLRLPRGLYQLFIHDGVETLGRLFARITGRPSPTVSEVEKVRAITKSLFRAGLLQFVPAPDRDGASGPATAEGR